MSELSEIEKLRLEHEALQQIVQYFANMPIDVGSYDTAVITKNIEKARNILAAVRRRQKPVKAEDPVERACFFITNAAKSRAVPKPFIVFERIEARSWNAIVVGHEPEFGIGVGKTALEAAHHLLGLVRAVPIHHQSHRHTSP